MVTRTIDMKELTRKRYNYSAKERAILSALGKPGKRLTSTVLIDKVYGEEPPLHARPALMTMLTLLIRKIEHNREPFRIMRTTGNGPNPHEFWLEMR